MFSFTVFYYVLLCYLSCQCQSLYLLFVSTALCLSLFLFVIINYKIVIYGRPA